MKCRLVQPAGKRYEVVWVKDTHNGHCHVYREHITKEQWNSDTKFDDFERDQVVCNECNQSFTTSPSFCSRTVWNTEDGELHPGDMYWAPYYHSDEGECHGGWDNCNDIRGHLIVLCPNGHEWDIDSRASNCTMKDDRTHRCWVRHGKPPNITVDKRGLTCSAGAGSIQAGDYHGFLRAGEFVDS